MRSSALFAALLAPTLLAQSYQVQPQAVLQGWTLHLSAPADAVQARTSGRVVRLFPRDGASAGLMPVAAAESPGSHSLEFLAGDGRVLYAEPVTIRDARYGSQNIILPPAVAGLAPSPGEMETADAFRKAVSEVRYWEDSLALPVSGCMTSPFGVKRLRNGKPTGDYHAGIDQRAPAGAPIRAIASGIVRIVRTWNIHGGTVAVDHGQGLESIYLHMSRFAVTEGVAVKQGDILGYAGSTGRSTASHLHWSIYVNSVPVSPSQWVTLEPCAPKPPPSAGRR